MAVAIGGNALADADGAGGFRAALERSLPPLVDLLRRGQSSDGGWGPAVTSPPEVFDTALALLGLAEVGGPPELIARGRAFLEKMQYADGSWPETTRPPGAESYAQRISTTGWATLALLRVLTN